MANDIYFGSRQPQEPVAPTPREAPPRAADRQPVTRDPHSGTGGAYSGRAPARDDGMMEQMRSMGVSGSRTNRPKAVRSSPPAAGGRTDRPAGTTAAPPAKNVSRDDLITERIDSELLHRAPTQILCNFIDTDDADAGLKPGKRISEKKKQKIRNKKIKAAQKSAKKAAKRSKKSGFGKFVKALLCVILVLALLVTGATAYVITGYRPQKLTPNAYVGGAELMSSPAVYNLLLMGIDTENTADSSRSDSMILLSIDNAHSKLKATSFMRDCYVTIPGHGEEKLNASCTYGGPQLVRDTIEYNFGVRIDGYIKIGYDVMKELVDGLGGITIPEVDAVEAAALAAEGYDAPIGTEIRMNGHQAVLYCRIRKGQSDFYRTERQREVLGILIKKALRTNPVTLALLGRKLLAKAECSLPQAELFALAFRVLPCLIGGVVGERVPLDGAWYDDTRNGQAVLVVNFEENRAFLQDYIYGK